MKEPNNMKYIIFDIDGTLTDTTKVDDKCYMESFESLFNTSIKDVKWNLLKNVTDWGITEELISQKLNREMTQKDLSGLKKLFLSNIKKEYHLDNSHFNEIDGAKYFFNSLVNNKDYHIGIATGGWGDTATFKLNQIGINPDPVSFANSDHFKERENITLDVINQLDAITSSKPEEIIYFGDGEWDYQTCKNLGIRFIGIDSSNNDKLKRIGAEEVYSNFNSYEKIMATLKR